MVMRKIILIRHGASEWNLLNLFTGWTDVDLSEQGVREAREAGRKLKEAGIEFDMAFTSVLQRAIKTCHIVLDEMDQLWIPEVKSWRLNERHYGDLQGLNKQETAEKYGEDQVLKWRRSYNTLPPLMDPIIHCHPFRNVCNPNCRSRVFRWGETLEPTWTAYFQSWTNSTVPHESIARPIW